jgi:hypothetical protein
MHELKEENMPLESMIVVAAIVAAFTLFGVALAWADFQTRPSGKKPVQAASDPSLLKEVRVRAR